MRLAQLCSSTEGAWAAIVDEYRLVTAAGADQAGGVHVGRGDIEVQRVQADWGVQERLIRVAVRLRQKRIPRAQPHCLDHLLPAIHVGFQ